MQLYLVRHAIAFDRDPVQWPDDRDRPLTPDGKKRFRQAARGLDEIVQPPDLVLSSRFARAWATAEMLVKEADWPEPDVCESLESGHTPADVLHALVPRTGVDSVALVGHEPGLTELAAFLLLGAESAVPFLLKKGGVLGITFPGGSPVAGAGRLEWLLTPRVLRRLSD